MKLVDIIREQFEEMPMPDFAETRLKGATKIATDAKEKGGPAILTYHHFVVKLEHYKKAVEGKFSLEETVSLYNKYMDELHELMQEDIPNPIEFQRVVGLIEVFGELIIKNKTTKVQENLDKMTIEEKLNLFLEKNCPTDPGKWSASKAAAKSKFDVYPSAYANGWAAKNYKSKGGGWRTCNEGEENALCECWDGYKQIGGKMKNGKMVPNCVPISEEDAYPNHDNLRDADDEINYGYVEPTEYDVENEDDMKDFIVFIKEYNRELNEDGCPCVFEAEYQGRKVKLGKPMAGDVKKFKVYVKNDKGNVVKVNFGQKGVKIKKNNPDRRRSFRARHNCDTPGPRWKARYWSCRKW